MKKELKEIAHKIVELEKQAREEPGFNYAKEMNDCITGLSLKDILAIDDYIQSKNLLTK